MSKLGSSVFTEIFFHRFPVSLVVPELLTLGANGEQAAQRLYFLQCFLEFLNKFFLFLFRPLGPGNIPGVTDCGWFALVGDGAAAS